MPIQVSFARRPEKAIYFQTIYQNASLFDEEKRQRNVEDKEKREKKRKHGNSSDNKKQRKEGLKKEKPLCTAGSLIKT